MKNVNIFLTACVLLIAGSPTLLGTPGNCTGTATNMTCTNTDGTITFPSTGTFPPNSVGAPPYPSVNPVSGMSGTITGITVTLTNLNESAPQDLGFMLVAPNGTTNLVFMSNAGGVDFNNTAHQVTYIISDAGVAQLPYNTAPPSASGTYKPTSQDPDGTGATIPSDYNTNNGYFDVAFPSPAPTPLFSGPRNGSNPSLNGVFGGLNPNGTWKLYAVQTSTGTGDTGLTLANWSLSIQTASLTGTGTTLASSQNPSFTSAPNNSVTFTATVTSGGNPVTAGTVGFKDGANIIATCTAATLDVNGQAQCTVNFTVEGAHQITAVYSGGATFASSNGTLTQQVDNHTTNPSGTKFCNTGPISLTSTRASVYPSHVYVPPIAGAISTLSLSLSGVTTTDMSSVAALLVSPDGSLIVPLNEAGQAAGENNVSFTLQDGSPLAPLSTSLLNGSTYGPTAYPFAVSFPAPAPPLVTANYASTIGSATFGSVFGGASSNGSGANAGMPWSLFIADGSGSTPATIAGGWCIDLTITPPQLTVTKTHTGPGTGNAFVVGQQGKYMIVVGNSGPGSTNGATITLSDPLPTGFTTGLISGSGGWNCSASTQTNISCTNSTTLAAGGSSGSVVVNVVPNSTSGTSNIVNTATASDTGLTTGSGQDTANVIHGPVLGVTVTDSGTGTFTQGDTGRTFTITVNNTSGVATSGTTTLTLNLSDATALVPTAITPNGWTCGALSGSITCTNSSVVNVGNSFPAVTLTVNVAPNATSPQTLTAAASGGGSANLPSKSDTVTILKTQTINFTQPADHMLSDSPVTLAATATSTLAVSFSSNSTGVCTVSGTQVTLLTTGTCSITANQAGNATYAPAPPVTLTFQVNKNSQTINFTQPADHTFGDAPFNLTATSTSGLTVTFTSNSASVCTVSGVQVTIVAAGICSISADQAGNATFAPATTVTKTFNVNPKAQTITFTQPADHTFGDPPFNLVATSDSGLTVAFASNSPAVCTVSGVQVTIVAGGACSITATQAGNANYLAATPVTKSFTVNPKAQTITFTQPADHTFGDPPFNLTATSDSGLTVTFASNSPAVCTVSGSQVTIVGGGNCSITASQAGNASYLAATPVTKSFTVNPKAQTITFTQPADHTFGDAPFNLAATSDSGLTVTFASNSPAVCTVSGSQVTIVGGGNCSITASQAGNASYLAATPVTKSFTVNQKAQTITFTQPADHTFGDSPFNLTATSNSGLTVTFASNSPAVCSVSGSQVTILATGPCSITASQAGNANYLAATPVTKSFTVNPKAQTITFTQPADHTFGDSPFNLAATSDSGLAVTFASNSLSVCTVSGIQVTLVGGGICSITASQAGNANYLAATPVTKSFTVNPKAQTITFTQPANHTFGDPPFNLSATSDSGLTVTFASNSPPVCTVSGSQVSITGAGVCSITASQAGNASYSPATPVTKTFTVSQKSQTITFVQPADHTFGDAPFNVTATSDSGLTVTVASNTPAVCTASGTQVSIVGAGLCSLTASQAGNANYLPATPVTKTFTLNKASQTINFGPLSTKVYGTPPFNVSATSSSGLAVSFASLTTSVCTVSGTQVTLVMPGTCSIQATQAGNANYLAATPVTQSFSVAGADMTITKTHTGHFAQGQTDATYTLTATNSGAGPTVGAVQVVDNLPSGLTATAIAGTGWSCTLGTLTCTRSDVLGSGFSYQPISVTVSVSATAQASVINQATVSGGGETNLSNDMASDPTTINPIVVVSPQVSVTQTGFVRNRATGIWSATMTVTNTGGSAIAAPIQVVLNNLTAGVTMTNNTGLRNGSPYITVVSSGSLAPGASVSVVIQFSNPGNGFIGFTPETDSGTY